VTVESGCADSLQAWVEAGLITAEQAEAIAAHEAAAPSAAPADTAAQTGPTQDSRTALAVEVLGYLGGALALAAVAFIVAQMWESLGDIGQIALVGVATVGLLVAGAFLRRAQQQPLVRLARFLWFLAVGGVAATTFLIADTVVAELGGDEWEYADQIGAVVSGAAFASGAILWLLERKALQLTALFISLMYFVFAVLNLFIDLQAELISWVAWGIGLAWLACTHFGVLKPRTAGYALAAVTLVLSPQLAAVDTTAGMLVAMLILGVVTALALLGAALYTEERLFLGFGALGILIYVPQLTFELFGDETFAAPLVLMVTGLSLIAVAVLYARMRKGPSLSDPSM